MVRGPRWSAMFSIVIYILLSLYHLDLSPHTYNRNVRGPSRTSYRDSASLIPEANDDNSIDIKSRIIEFNKAEAIPLLTSLTFKYFTTASTLIYFTTLNKYD